MSFVAGLLARELGPSAPFGHYHSAAGPGPGTTPDAEVVPRLTSRFEEPGAPRWPGTAGDSVAGVRDRGETRSRDAASDGPDATAPDAATGNLGPVLAAVRPLVGNPAVGDGGPDARTPGRPDGGVAEGPGEPSLHRGTALPGFGRPANMLPPFERRARQEPDMAAAGSVPPMDPAMGRGGTRPGSAFAGPHAAATGMGRLAGDADVVPYAPRTPKPPRKTEPVGANGQEDPAVWPRLDPLPRPETVRKEPSHIHVSIGRIEVRAVASPPPRPAGSQEPTGLMGLDEYLRGHS